MEVRLIKALIIPYWRLSSFYFFFFATVGALVPYLALYLNSLGYGAIEISWLVASLMATKIVSPYLWGWVADKTAAHLRVVQLGTLLCAIFFVGILLTSEFWGLLLTLVLFGFFWNASLPQFETITFRHLQANIERYPRIRLWGSVGFILSVVVIGSLLARYGPEIIPWLVLGLLCGLVVASGFTPNINILPTRDEGNDTLVKILRKREVWVLFLVCLLMQASHGPYYTFFTLYLEKYAYSQQTIGQLWAIGVLAEVGLFYLAHRFMHRHRFQFLLLLSLLLTSIRWLVTALFPESLTVIAFAQLFHAASFGLFHATAIMLVNQYFSGIMQGRGQALYSSMSFGVGGALGSLYSGYVWEHVSSSAAFFVASGLVFAAFLVALWGLRPDKPRKIS